MDRQEDRLSNLPPELVVHILSYVKIMDLLTVSGINDTYKNICISKSLIHKINLFMEYNLNISHWNTFMVKTPTPVFVSSLNINGVYWIPKELIRKGVSKLVNLDELFAIDTGLNFHTKDLQIYEKLTKLKKLTVSVRSTIELNNKANISSVNFLYILHYGIKTEFIGNMEHIISYFPCLQNIRICTLSSSKYEDRYYECVQLPKVCAKLGFDVCIARRSDNYRINNPTLDDYRPFHELIVSKKEDPQNKEQNAKFIRGESLNIACNFTRSCSLLDELYEDLVYNGLFKDLKKLSISYCLVIEDMFEEGCACDQCAKKRKIRQNFLSKLCKKCPNIEELEIWDCKKGRILTEPTMLKPIKNFKKLKKLTLDSMDRILSYCETKFLVMVVSSCTLLNTLRIKSNIVNAQLNNYLCLALKNAHSLENLRVHVANLPIDRILESIPKNGLLRTVYLETTSITSFTAQKLYTFIENHTSLMFYGMIIKESVAASTLQKIERQCKKICKGSPKIIVLNKSHDKIKMENLPCIFVHNCFSLYSHVETIDVFDMKSDKLSRMCYQPVYVNYFYGHARS